jgi:8-oxo-dGTP pyrophosphatase MutT (NUDIX family)
VQTVTRPAVRIICLDAGDQVLMLQWRDPLSAEVLWEPPGGGIEPGETPLEAARRELAEETGLDPSAIGESYVEVHRDNVWNGKRFVGPEQFFLARYRSLHAPPLQPLSLTVSEQHTLLGHTWVSRPELPTLPNVVPVTLDAEITRLITLAQELT